MMYYNLPKIYEEILSKQKIENGKSLESNHCYFVNSSYLVLAIAITLCQIRNGDAD
jgi:hypothetical protein